jgi:hypothetical protein
MQVGEPAVNAGHPGDAGGLVGEDLALAPVLAVPLRVPQLREVLLAAVVVTGPVVPVAAVP